MAMITYPLNNIQYSAEDAELYNSVRTSGVFDGDSDFSISIVSGLKVLVNSGIAWIQNAKFKGKVVALKNAQEITLPNPPTSNSRYDVIAVRFDENANSSSIVVKQGSVSSSPSLPARSKTESLYELFLYQIQRQANAYTITSADIVDLRKDPTYCGIMSDPVSAGLPKSGGTMSGDIEMGGNKISGLGNPSENSDALPLGVAKGLFAPSGYGLGNTVSPPLSDFNDVVKNGFYSYGIDNLNRPNYIPYGALFVITRYNGINQIVFGNDDGITAGGINAQRRSRDGGATWGEWEYFNSPMIVGVEYRTTERWNGKVVYCKTIDYGKLPNTTYKAVAHTSTMTRCIRYNLTNKYSGFMLTGHRNISVEIGDSVVQITTFADLSAYQAYCTMWYIKD